MGRCASIDPVAGGEALVVLEGHTDERAGVDCFRRPGDGRTSPRERIGDGSVRVWDLAAGGAALFVLEGHTG